MELNIKVNVQTPNDVLRYGRSGALPMDLAARTCLSMIGWKDREIDAVLPKAAPSAKKMGRPSGFDARRNEVKSLVDAGTSVSDIASTLKVSIPTARAWINRLTEEQPSAAEVEVDRTPGRFDPEALIEKLDAAINENAA